MHRHDHPADVERPDRAKGRARLCPELRRRLVLRLRPGGDRGQLSAQGFVEVTGAPSRRHEGILRPAHCDTGSGRLLARPFDLEDQVANTLRPFGIPRFRRCRRFPNFREQIARIRDRGWAVSGRRVQPAEAQRRRRAQPQDRRPRWPDAELPHRDRGRCTAANDPGWAESAGRLDQGPVRSRPPAHRHRAIRPQRARHTRTRGPARTPRRRRSGPARRGARRGDRRGRDPGPARLPPLQDDRLDDRGRRAAGHCRCADEAVLWQMAGPAALLLLAGGLAALFTARQVERLLRTLSTGSPKRRGEVTELSGSCSPCRRRSADASPASCTTPPSSASLRPISDWAGLKRTSTEPGRPKTRGEIGDLLDRALLELRIFTYLLHPPSLADHGLRPTLQEFSKASRSEPA